MVAKDPNELVRTYLSECKLLHLATSIKDQPWVSNLWFAYDPELNLYFISKKDRRHCTELKKQPKVAGGIVSSKFEGPDQKVRGLSFQGLAEEIHDDDAVTEAYKIYEKRLPQLGKAYPLAQILSIDAKPKMYKIVPSLFVLFDEENFPENPRQELKLK